MGVNDTAEAIRYCPALRIFVVDDNRDHADTLVRLLHLFGYEAKAVCDPAGALIVANEFLPHVFLIDLVMPAMNGIALAQRLRQASIGKDALLIGMSAFPRRANEAAIRAFDHFLLKPVDRFALERILEKWAKLVGCDHPP